MISLRETIAVKRPIDEAFTYVADFTTAPEWDATTTRATKLTDGKIGCATRFLVTCDLPLASIDISFEVVQYQPPRQIVLRGKCWLFTLEDTITLTETAAGTEVEYGAVFSLARWLRPFRGLLEPRLQRMGRDAVAGLKQALEDNAPPPPPQNPEDKPPGMKRLFRFTRFGYRQAKKAWQPMSADIRGKHAVITGTSSGLGLACAEQLAHRGAHLTLVMRNPERAQAVRDELRKTTGNPHIDVEIADLSLLAQVDDLAARLLAAGKPIDILINNAGALFDSLQHTPEGLERSVALLLLSPYRLTLALRPLLGRGEQDSRVINVVSGGMYSQKLSMRNLVATSPEKFSGAVAYARAKRALMIVTQQWAADWKDQGIVVNAMHPGWADTPGVEKSLPRFHSLTRFILRSPMEGADTIVWLAAASEAVHVAGELFLDRQTQPLHLTTSTQETPQEREKLFSYLNEYAPPQTNATPKVPA